MPEDRFIPHSEIIHTLIALMVVSIASLVGSLSFALGRRLNAALPYLVSASVGALLSTALTHLIPEALERLHSARKLGVLLLIGFVVAFLLERALWFLFRPAGGDAQSATDHPQPTNFHHGHERHGHNHALASNILLSGGVHSFVDGIAIATAFASGHSLGLATTIAVLMHEVPHHVADVGVLIYSGLERRRAVLLNLLATLGCGLGGVLVLVFGSHLSFWTPALLPLTAANFLYIGLAILMPELQREPDKRRSILQFLSMVGMSALILWVGTLEKQ